MGGKRDRCRQHVYLCVALTILLSLAACATIRSLWPQYTLGRGKDLLAQGDYEGSLRENQRLLSLSPHESPGDEALFNMGLVYANVKNSKRDNQKAIGFFNRVVKEFPRSPLAEQAKVWLGVLEMNERLSQIIEKSKKVDIEIEEKKRQKER
jgi:tetratricopeptide (TPR) repeat protein